MNLVEKSLNPAPESRNFPKLDLHVGIDYGKNNVVLYGADKHRSYIDLRGPIINLGAKMQSISGKNKIIIGDRVFTKINSSSKKKKIIDLNRWQYQIEHSKNKPSSYSLYECSLK